MNSIFSKFSVGSKITKKKKKKVNFHFETIAKLNFT